jgi:hypothetical protein
MLAEHAIPGFLRENDFRARYLQAAESVGTATLHQNNMIDAAVRAADI